MAPLKPPFYVISDSHWFHKNIIRYANRPADHEAMMLKRWKRTVRESDTILHLGDLFFGGEKGYERFRLDIAPQLTGQKYLVLGNHDRKRWDYKALGFTVIKPFTCVYRNYRVSFDHYPKLLDNKRDFNRIHVHGHLHNHVDLDILDDDARFGNVNVSVEVLNYRPHRVTRLLNSEIAKRHGKERYYNSRHVRWRKYDRQRRAV